MTFANTIPSTVTGNSDTADYKDTILKTAPPITNCGSTTVTTPKVVTDTSTNPDTASDVPAGGASIGSGVLAVADSAVVDIHAGTATPAGSVAFSLCKVDAPARRHRWHQRRHDQPHRRRLPRHRAVPHRLPSRRQAATAGARRGVVTRRTRSPARATLAGTECFTINPVTPTLSTSAGADVLLGNPVTDRPTLAGRRPSRPTAVIHTTGHGRRGSPGTIAFTLWGPERHRLRRTGLAPGRRTVTASAGNDTYNARASVPPDDAWEHHWVAVYSGDPPNTNSVTHNAACTDTNEDVTVNTVASSMTTEQSWVPNDSATDQCARRWRPVWRRVLLALRQR